MRGRFGYSMLCPPGKPPPRMQHCRLLGAILLSSLLLFPTYFLYLGRVSLASSRSRPWKLPLPDRVLEQELQLLKEEQAALLRREQGFLAQEDKAALLRQDQDFLVQEDQAALVRRELWLPQSRDNPPIGTPGRPKSRTIPVAAEGLAGASGLEHLAQSGDKVAVGGKAAGQGEAAQQEDAGAQGAEVVSVPDATGHSHGGHGTGSGEHARVGSEGQTAGKGRGTGLDSSGGPGQSQGKDQTGTSMKARRRTMRQSAGAAAQMFTQESAPFQAEKADSDWLLRSRWALQLLKQQIAAGLSASKLQGQQPEPGLQHAADRLAADEDPQALAQAEAQSEETHGIPSQQQEAGDDPEQEQGQQTAPEGSRDAMAAEQLKSNRGLEAGESAISLDDEASGRLGLGEHVPQRARGSPGEDGSGLVEDGSGIEGRVLHLSQGAGMTVAEWQAMQETEVLERLKSMLPRGSLGHTKPLSAFGSEDSAMQASGPGGQQGYSTGALLEAVRRVKAQNWGPTDDATADNSFRGHGIARAKRYMLPEALDLTRMRHVSLNPWERSKPLVRMSCRPKARNIPEDDFSLSRCPRFEACDFLLSSKRGQAGMLPGGNVVEPFPHGQAEACSTEFNDPTATMFHAPPLNCRSWYTMNQTHKLALLKPYLQPGVTDLREAASKLLRRKPELGCAQSYDFYTVPGAQYRVYRLKDVYLSKANQVFNSSTMFEHNGCQPRSGVKVIENGTQIVMEVPAAANWFHPFGVNFYHTLTDSLPVLIFLAPILRKGVPLAAQKYQFNNFHKFLGPLLGVDIHKHRYYAMIYNEFYYVHNLYQAVNPYPASTSQHLMTELRRRYFLNPSGVPVFNQDWTPRATTSLSDEEMLRYPDDWVVVVHQRVGSSRSFVGIESVVDALLQMLPKERVVHMKGSPPILEARAIFMRTRLFVCGHGAGLTNMIFMPANSSVVEIRPNGWPAGCYHNLADASAMRYYLVMGQGGKSGNITFDVQELVSLVHEIVREF